MNDTTNETRAREWCERHILPRVNGEVEAELIRNFARSLDAATPPVAGRWQESVERACRVLESPDTIGHGLYCPDNCTRCNAAKLLREASGSAGAAPTRPTRDELITTIYNSPGFCRGSRDEDAAMIADAVLALFAAPPSETTTTTTENRK